MSYKPNYMTGQLLAIAKGHYTNNSDLKHVSSYDVLLKYYKQMYSDCVGEDRLRALSMFCIQALHELVENKLVGSYESVNNLYLNGIIGVYGSDRFSHSDRVAGSFLERLEMFVRSCLGFFAIHVCVNDLRSGDVLIELPEPIELVKITQES